MTTILSLIAIVFIILFIYVYLYNGLGFAARKDLEGTVVDKLHKKIKAKEEVDKSRPQL
jgi:Na+-transporting methylmalonyl-CoA/oxaloacetate decarboxylase gamma subunit